MLKEKKKTVIIKKLKLAAVCAIGAIGMTAAFSAGGLQRAGIVRTVYAAADTTPDTMTVVSGWKTENGSTYYFGMDGKAYTGLNKISGSLYYFDNAGKMITDKFVKVDGKKYYFGADGRAYTGVCTIKGNKYYFSKKGYLTSGKATINGKKYRFKKSGTPYTGWYTTKGGKKMYYRADGSAVTDAYVISGKVYLFAKSGIQITKKGWHTNKSGKYYVSSKGRLLTGYQKINGSYYYFSKKGKMYRRKWAYAKGYKFYFGKDGKRLNDVDSVLGKQDSYEIVVNKTTNVVTVYAKDGNKGYIIPVKAIICSTGEATPVGTFYTPAKFRWLTLMGPVYGQWDTQITGDILFHSVYYGKTDACTLNVSAYNQLGTTCSHGCVRLTAGDAKWIYDNCELRTKVTVIEGDVEGPFPKPSSYKLDYSHTWDPTDPEMNYKCRQNGCH